MRRRLKPTIHGLILLVMGTASLSAGRLATPAAALFTGQQAAGDNVFTTLSLSAPGSLSANPQGHDISLTWSAGQNGTGYAVRGAANGASSDCSAASFSLITSTVGTGVTDGGRYAPQGSWFCYQVETTRDAWTSLNGNPIVAVQLGFVASAVSLANNGDSSACSGEQSGVADELDCGDQVAIDFNQAVDPMTGPSSGHTACVYQASNTVWLGSTTASGPCAESETVSVGKLISGTVGGCDCRFNAGYAWSNGNTRLTVTIGARISGSMYPTFTNPWTLSPTTDSAQLLSSSGSHHICDNNDNGGPCWPGTN